MLTQEYIKSILRYDPDTGFFTWLVRTGLRVQVGDVAGSIRPDGYININVNREKNYAHRLAFLYMTGSFPPDQVDHINGNPSDNSWKNLRSATRNENMRNTKMQKRNVSGLTGVSRDYRFNIWCVRVRHNGKQLNSSFADSKFGTKEFALEHAKDFAGLLHETLGFHPNHGRSTKAGSTHERG
jgi:hypothetical protein